MQTMRAGATAQAKSFIYSKLAEVFTALILQHMNTLIPGFNMNNFAQHLAADSLEVVS